MEEIIELKGNSDGPISMILVGVHGNERCGVEAIQKLLPTLEIAKGTVYIGYGNPKAIEQNVRFTEANLNRMFKSDSLMTKTQKQSYEYTRAQFLKTYMDKSEVLLDVHATSNPKSKVFAICEENAFDIAKFLPTSLVVSGFEEIEQGGTDGYMHRVGKIGICFECGNLADKASTDMAESAIMSFLKVREHITGAVEEKKEQQRIHMYQLYFTKTDSFIVAKPFADFEEVQENQIIGTDGDQEIKAPKAGIVLFAKSKEKVGEEAFLLGEYI